MLQCLKWLSLVGSFIHLPTLFWCLLHVRTREGNGIPLQYSCLENPMDGGAWKGAVHGVTEGQTRLSDFTFTFHFHALEKEMATHSSVLAWRLPGMGEPDGLPAMELHRVRHDWNDLASAALKFVGLWLSLGFSVGMEAFGWAIIVNVPWSQEFSGVLEFGI